jgi:integrase
MCGLQWFDLNFERGLIHVRNTKNGKDRLIPMNATVRALLENQPKTSSYVFPSPRTGERLVEIKYSFVRAIKGAKITAYAFPTSATRGDRHGRRRRGRVYPGCDLRLVRHSDGDALHPRYGGRKAPSSRSNRGWK